MKDLIRRILREQHGFENYEDFKKHILVKRAEDELHGTQEGVYSIEDLKKKEKKHYKQALENNWVVRLADELEFDDAAPEGKRKLYVYTWEEEGDEPKKAYVGLTCNVITRNKKHTKTLSPNFYCNTDVQRKRITAVGKYILERKDKGLNPTPKFKVVTTDFINDVDAQNLESQLHREYDNMGYEMLNSSDKLGILGATRTTSKYNSPNIWKFIKDNKTYSASEIENRDPDLYQFLMKNGFQKYGINHPKQRDYHSDEDLLKIIQSGSINIHDFKNTYPNLFKKVFRRNKIDEFYKDQLSFKSDKDPNENLNTIERVVNYVQQENQRPDIKIFSIINNLIDYGSFKFRNNDGETITINQTKGRPENYKKRISKPIFENIIKKVLNEESEEIDQKVYNFLRRRYEINEVNIEGGIKFKEIYFKVGDEYYGVSMWDNKKRQVRLILNMLVENDVTEPIDNFSNENDPYRQKVVRTIKKFLYEVM